MHYVSSKFRNFLNLQIKNFVSNAINIEKLFASFKFILSLLKYNLFDIVNDLLIFRFNKL